MPPSKRSAPDISRFNPVLGWRTILQLLARRAAESIAFSVPDRNALWSRAEDDLVQAVPKYSSSNILGRDWIEVASEMPGRLPQQCQERYRLADVLAELTFVLFLCVTFRDSPLVPSAPVTSLEHTHPMPTSSRSSPCSRCSLSHAHKFMGFFRNRTALASASAIPTTYSVSDNIVAFTLTPTPRSRCSVSHTHSNHTPTLHTTTLLTFTCTQVLWFLPCLIWCSSHTLGHSSFFSVTLYCFL